MKVVGEPRKIQDPYSQNSTVFNVFLEGCRFTTLAKGLRLIRIVSGLKSAETTIKNSSCQSEF